MLRFKVIGQNCAIAMTVNEIKREFPLSFT
jgi:hypothetical protein